MPSAEELAQFDVVLVELWEESHPDASPPEGHLLCTLCDLPLPDTDPRNLWWSEEHDGKKTIEVGHAACVHAVRDGQHRKS